MVVRVLYFARGVDIKVIISLSPISSEQYTATEKTEAKVKQILDYLATNPATVIRFHVSDMILNIQLGASYLSVTRDQRLFSGHYMLGYKTSKGKPINTNRDIYVFDGTLKFVVASASEA